MQNKHRRTQAYHGTSTAGIAGTLVGVPALLLVGVFALMQGPAERSPAEMFSDALPSFSTSQTNRSNEPQLARLGDQDLQDLISCVNTGGVVNYQVEGRRKVPVRGEGGKILCYR